MAHICSVLTNKKTRRYTKLPLQAIRLLLCVLISSFFFRSLSFCFIIIFVSFRLRSYLISTSIVCCYRHFVWANSGAMTNIKMKTTEKKIIFLFRMCVVQPRVLFVCERAKCVSNEYELVKCLPYFFFWCT